MEKLGLNEIRELFLSFYQSKEHYRRQSFPLIPQNDKSLLIINSGMAPLKPYFAGIETPPSKRMTTCQKCIRTGDIENVGYTSRHGTFFEMLGSFSFGDYFKKESLTWGWEFITKVLKMPTDRLWATVYENDDDAYAIWRDVIGMPEERIVRLGKDDNFWEIGTGPCGPCSEIYFDRGEKYGCDNPDCKPGCDCDRYVEFWNHVFTQFSRDDEGNYSDLAHPNIDTGMGIERLACIMQGVESIFDVDTIKYILDAVVAKSGVEYKDGEAETDISIRIITDHLRSMTFMIGDSILPGNEGREYVLRRLIRRAARHGRILGIEGPFLAELSEKVIETSGDAYPELKQRRDMIKKVIAVEEEKFASTIDQGMKIINSYMDELKAEGSKTLDGEKAFKLHDTYGFPIDLTELIAREQGIEVDLEAFEKELQAQKERSRNAAAVDTDDWKELIHIKQSEFIGYDTLSAEVKIARYRRVSSKGRVSYQLVFDRTPFYGNSGGQIGDIGYIETANERIPVVATEKENGLIIHIVTQLPENPEATFMAVVDPEKRQAAANNHTATHLMHEALRKVLGTHVEQKGSLVTPEYLRFDFSHFQKVTHEELRRVEQLVNRAIRANYPLEEKRDATKEEAAAAGAMMLFGEKYGDRVRMVRFGTSVELCGGTHVSATGNIGFFKILNESAISAGVRRIEATTGAKAEEVIYAAEDTMRNVADYLNNPQILQSIKKIMESNEALKHEMEAIRREQVAEWAAKIVDSTPERGGMRLMATQTDRRPDFIKDLAFAVRSRSKNIVLVIGSINDGKPTLTVALGDDIVAQGVNAGVVVREAAKAINGGGGGQPFLATAGGKNPDGIQAAIDKAVELIVEQVK